MSGLVIDDVSMTFELPNGGKVEALKNINLNIKEGELMSVLGPSGCGKSTYLRCLNRIFELYREQRVEGKIMIDGKNIFDKSVGFLWYKAFS